MIQSVSLVMLQQSVMLCIISYVNTNVTISVDSHDMLSVIIHDMISVNSHDQC